MATDRVIGEKKDVPRTFLSKAYIVELEKGLWGLYRDVLVETNEFDKEGKPIREKVGKPLGPIGVLREMQKGEEEKVILRSYDPKLDKLLELVKAT